MAVECDRMYVVSRWIYGADSRKDPKTLNPDYHPPVLFHHNAKTGDAYFTDVAGQPLDPESVPQYIRDNIAENPVHVVPQFAPPHIREFKVDPVTGQEVEGQNLYRDVVENVPLLNENRSNDLAAIENKRLRDENQALKERFEKLEKALQKQQPKKRGRPKGSKNKPKSKE